MDITTHRGEGTLQQVIEIGPHRVLSDASVASGGQGSAPEPHDLLAAALAACTALTVTMYARRKGYQLDDIAVSIQHGQEGGAYVLNRSIRYIGALAEDEKVRLTEIANKCPVHKTLSGQIQIHTEVRP